MRYRWRVSVPSSSGIYTRILSSAELEDLKNNTSVGKDNYLTFALMLVSWVSLIGDSPLEKNKPNRIINRFFNDLVDDPIRVISSLSEVAGMIESNLFLSGDIPISRDAFMILRRTPVVREYLEFMKTSDPQLLRYLLTFLNFGKKVAYQNDKLDATAFRGWQEVEDRLRYLTIPEWTTNLKFTLAWIMKSAKCPFTFLPKHGNGAVAERGVRGVKKKNNRMKVPKRIQYLYNKDIDIFDDSDIGHPSFSTLNASQTGNVRLSSRLKFVPKTWETSRSICMEPVVFQWAQQGVRTWLERKIAEGILGKHVVLKDQSFNQRGARYGSTTGRADTIDLSSASDSVAWTLVKSVFPSDVLKHLSATRTSEVELPDGSTQHIHKFAPMGSALCFPTQSILYSAIILMITVADAYGRDWRIPGSLSDIDLDVAYFYAFGKGTGRSKYFPFLAYGDDLVVDHTTTSNVVEALTQLGFQVNVSKSFLGDSAYRESCGKHYYRGTDVTPFRFKTRAVSPRIDVTTLASIIDTANRAGQFAYDNCRKHLIQFILYYPIMGVKENRHGSRNPVLFSNDPDDSMAIISSNPHNYHLKKREFGPDAVGTSLQFQRDEVESITMGPQSKVHPSKRFDGYYYTLWWRSRYYDEIDESRSRMSSSEDSSSVITADAFGTAPRWRWTPT